MQPILRHLPMLWLILPATGMAGQAVPATDANVLTAIDISESIGRPESALEFEGMARAVVDPRFLEAIQGGFHGRIGFAVMAWAAGRNHHLIVPWTVIGSAVDAGQVSARLMMAAATARHGVRSFAAGLDLVWYEVRTDVSATIEIGDDLLANAPYRAGRSILNVIANGIDNVGGGPDDARDAAVLGGTTINALVIGDQDQLAPYYRAHVQGGVGSFVLPVDDQADLTEAMVTKFLRDLIAGRRVVGFAPG